MTILKRISCYLLAVAVIMAVGVNMGLPVKVSANMINVEMYSDVRTDLMQDSSFDFSSWPSDNVDYSVSVITFAEDVNRNLFVYTYQPSVSCPDCVAINISFVDSSNMSINNSDRLLYEQFSLIPVSRYGVFRKYLVDGLKVKEDYERSYDISSIYRSRVASDDYYDSDVYLRSYKVGLCWTFTGYYNSNDKVLSCHQTEVIAVTDKFDLHMFLTSNMWFMSRYGNDYDIDAYCVVFSTDKSIDKLLEADVFYSYHTYHNQVNGWFNDYGWSDTLTGTAELTYLQTFEYTAGAFGKKYCGDRIMSSTQLLEYLQDNNIELSSEDLSTIADLDWALFYTEFDNIDIDYGMGSSYREYSVVTSETILRLKYVDDGVVYNLGVVDNATQPSVTPNAVGTDTISDAVERSVESITDWWSDLTDRILGYLKTAGIVLLVIVIAWLVVKIISVFIDLFSKK